MPNTLKPKHRRGAIYVICRGLIVFCCTITLTTTLIVAQTAQPVWAATSMATIRQDRRPDRERVINYGQGSSTSSTAQSSSSTSHTRPHLVHH